MDPHLLVLTLPGPALELRVADVQGDGGRDLVAATPRASGGLTLTVLSNVQQDLRATQTVHLEARPAWWDAGQGLWVQDATGLRRVDGGAERRLLSRATGLPSGPGTPRNAALVVDLDHDGRAELLLRGAEEVLVVRADGRLWGVVPAPPKVALGVASRAGGQALEVALVPPALAVCDLDGDGLDDLLLIDDEALRAHHALPGGFAPTPRVWPLPPALAPQRPGSELTSARWADLDGDGRCDLLAHRLRTGTLAETGGELHLLRGTPGGLGPAQVVPTRGGSDEAFLVDLDADGDLDVLVPGVPLDPGNLAQALVQREVEVALDLLVMEGGALAPPARVGSMDLPVEGGAAAWSMFEDLDGDGLPDLAVVVNGRLLVHPGDGRRVDPEPALTLELGLAATRLWAVDLLGDDAAELVAWAPGEARLVVVRLR